MVIEPGSNLFLDLALSCFVFFFWFKSFLCLIHFFSLISLSYGAAPVNLNIKAGGRAYGSSGKKIYTVILVENEKRLDCFGLRK